MILWLLLGLSSDAAAVIPTGAVYPTIAVYVDDGVGGGGGGGGYQTITLGLGTPATIGDFILFGLAPAGGGVSWGDLSDDLVAELGVRIKYGIDGNGPKNVIASTGQAQYSLRNDAGNSASTMGYYSPAHASKRAGWTHGLPMRIDFTYDSVIYTKFRGKIRVIDPDAGLKRNRRAHVVGYDVIRDMAEADAREVTIQVNQSEAALLSALIAVMPPLDQPVATDFDPGVDSYPYAFDNVAGEMKVLSVAGDVVISALGALFPKGDGTLVYRSRHSLSTGVSAYTFTDADMAELSVPSSLDGVFRKVRVTNHPKAVSPTATDLLYELPAGTTVEVGSGATVDVWTDYSDPNDRETNVGGTEVVTALEAGTHYAAIADAEISIDVTASLSASLYPFGTTAKWTFINGASFPILITKQNVIGKAVRDPGPRTFQAPQTGSSADRPIDIDLPYQDDPYVGQSTADYIYAQFSDLTQQVDSVTFFANRSHALMVQALTREPGDHITLSETVTGLSSVQCLIQSVELEFKTGRILVCKWGLRPANTTQFWQWGIVGASEWGVTTRYGF